MPMIIAVDIGGTKTLVAAVTADGLYKTKYVSRRLKTTNNFLEELAKNIVSVTTENIEIISVAVPGMLDRAAGLLKLGNLPWENKPIANDISERFEDADVLIENDANLAALSEAKRA